jgi:hypothetical protein
MASTNRAFVNGSTTNLGASCSIEGNYDTVTVEPRDAGGYGWRPCHVFSWPELPLFKRSCIHFLLCFLLHCRLQNVVSSS